jgi:hypothetical protein
LTDNRWSFLVVILSAEPATDKTAIIFFFMDLHLFVWKLSDYFLP